MIDANALAARMLLVSLATSFFVVAEPAATDLAFLLTALLVAVAVRLHVPRPGMVYCALAYLFLLTNAASATQCKNFYFCMRYMAITAYLVAIPVVMLHLSALYGGRYIDRLHNAFLLAVAVGALSGILARLGLMPGPTSLYFRADDGLRLSPFFKDPNVYAPFLSSGLILLLGHIVAGSKRFALGFPLLGLIWIPMFLAFSRAAWLNVAVSALTFIALMVALAPGREALGRLARVCLATVLVIVPVSALVLLQFDLLSFFEHRLGLQSYDSHRFAGHAAAIALAEDNPFGIGPGHFVGRTHFATSDFALAAHNVFLKVWVENSLLGLLSFLGLYAYLLARLFQLALLRTGRQAIHVALIACLMGTLVNGYFIDTLHWRHLFALMGFSLVEIHAFGPRLAAAARRRPERRRGRRPRSSRPRRAGPTPSERSSPEALVRRRIAGGGAAPPCRSGPGEEARAARREADGMAHDAGSTWFPIPVR